MKMLIPNELLALLECWLSTCYSCVKWDNTWSQLFTINFGVRQGSVLSPILFAVYVDDLVNLCRPTFSRGLRIVLYADDILLLVPSISALESLLNLCERERDQLDMVINNKKSWWCCIRIGPGSNITCAAISMSTGAIIPWMDEIIYLSVLIVRSRLFECSLDHAKKSFYRSANAIFGKVGRFASEDVNL